MVSFGCISVDNNQLGLFLLFHREILPKVINKRCCWIYCHRATADNKDICFCIGGHPGFACPMNAGEQFSDYKLVFEKVENEDVIYTTNYGGGYIDAALPVVDKLKNTNEWPLRHEDYDVDALLTKKLQSRKVRLVHNTTGKGIEFDFTGFNALGVWTPPGKKAPFVCIEPWNGLPAHLGESGNFEDKPYAITLGVGEEYTVGYSVKVIE